MNEEKTPEQIQNMVSEVNKDLLQVHSGTYDIEKCKKTAALALSAQLEISNFLSSVEGLAKSNKNLLEHIEAEIYIDCKSSSDKKLSDATVKEMVAKDEKTIKAKNALVESEKEYKKYSYIFAILKEAHVFFRNLANGKNDWSTNGSGQS